MEPMFSQDRRWTVSNGDLSEPLVHRRSLSLKRRMAQAVAARHTPHKQASNERYPFTGKLFCGVCGKPYCYYYTTTNKQPLAAYRYMSRKTQSAVDNGEDILVQYRAEEMCLLIDEIGKINEFRYPLMLKMLDKVVVNTNGKLSFIFQSGIKITV